MSIFRGAASIDGRPVALTPREFEVLAYVAIHGRTSPHRLAFDIWGQTSDERALNALYVNVHRLKAKLACGSIAVTPQGYGLAPPATADVRQLEAILKHAPFPADRATLATLDALADEVEGVFPARLEAAEWSTFVRARLDDARADFFERLGRAWIDRGEVERALAYVAKIDRLDCADERAFTLAIRAHAAAGDELSVQRVQNAWRRFAVHDGDPMRA